MVYMFGDCASLTKLDLSKWDTSKVIDMSGIFSGCSNLSSLNVSTWNTSKVTSMDSMFFDCKNLTTIKGIIDMSSCTNYKDMFYDCPNLTGVKIKNPPSGIDATTGIGGLAAGKYEIVS